MKLLPFTLILLLAPVLLLACGSGEKDASPLSLPEAQALAEEKLPGLAAKFGEGVPSEATIYELLERYLDDNGEFFGATFSVEPSQAGNAGGLAPYVFRQGDSLGHKDLAAVEGYDYTSQDWYAIPKQSRSARWSDVYFDAGGGDINMITYSIPVYMGGPDGTFIGILTTDLATDGRPSS